MTPVASPLRLRVEAGTVDAADERPSRVERGRADLRLRGGGRLRLTRDEAVARFRFAGALPPAADLLHPYLAPAAALTQMWAGREALHAGALLIPDGAVLLLGDGQSGKSTTLARWATGPGAGVLTDDLAILHEGCVLAGPRCLDLRPDSLAAGAAADRESVRGGLRRRLDLGPAPPERKLVGAVVLAWDAEVALRPVTPARRLSVLLAQRMFGDRVEADLAGLLDVVALPMLELTRPRGEAGLRGAVDALQRYFA